MSHPLNISTCSRNSLFAFKHQCPASPCYFIVKSTRTHTGASRTARDRSKKMLRKRSDETKAPTTPGTNASSQFRGVSFNTHSQKWKAVITVGRKQYFLGYYVNETEAARAYDKASLELRGPEAPTNFKYDQETLAAAAQARQASAQMVAQDIQDEDDSMGVEDAQCASLEKLEGMQTGESMESVRDVEVEVNAVRATLMMREQAIMNARAQRMKQDEVPAEFLCL